MVELSAIDRTVILAVGGTLGDAPFTGSNGILKKDFCTVLTIFFNTCAT